MTAVCYVSAHNHVGSLLRQPFHQSAPTLRTLPVPGLQGAAVTAAAGKEGLEGPGESYNHQRKGEAGCELSKPKRRAK